MPKKGIKPNAKEQVMTLAMAAISENSPARILATNTFLLHDIADLLKPSVSRLFACGGGETGGSTTAEIFDIEANTWTRVPDMVTRREGLGVVFAGGLLFAIGGWVPTVHTLNSVEAFDVEKGTWKFVPPMTEKRDSVTACATDDRVFVLGGEDGGKALDSCEMFDVTENRWHHLPPMPTARYNMGAAAIGHRVFVVGGNGYEHGGSGKVEVLNLETNRWSALPSMPTPRFSFAIAVTQDRFIWALGGLKSSTRLDSIEVFDVETNKWTKSAAVLPSPRFSPRAFACGDRIFVVGGNADEPLRSTEVLDTETLKWESAAPMNFSRTWHSITGF